MSKNNSSFHNGAFAKGGLNDLLSQSASAKEYFMSLPDYIQGMIQQRTGNIQSEDELHRYAENLLAGDK
ncbi:hypothetical protein [Hydrogenoanaerobacterium sp.]|uniref:hypothetical protein n=1 Tax=Hydrogenoanaerobacterium sp. TaxID=2953763 RepID=UPI0028994F07|nr:hypothetical protein [Hydrogenoanaerobacterium sp.]